MPTFIILKVDNLAKFCSSRRYVFTCVRGMFSIGADHFHMSSRHVFQLGRSFSHEYEAYFSIGCEACFSIGQIISRPARTEATERNTDDMTNMCCLTEHMTLSFSLWRLVAGSDWRPATSEKQLAASGPAAVAVAVVIAFPPSLWHSRSTSLSFSSSLSGVRAHTVCMQLACSLLACFGMWVCG